jgi:hypothetical protein
LKKFWRSPLNQRKEMIRIALQGRLARFRRRKISTGTESTTSWPAIYWLGKHFVAPTFGGNITVFKRRKQAYFYVRDPFMGWGSRTTAQVEVHVIDPFPHKHPQIFREPYVNQIAEQLSNSLERARHYRSFVTGEACTVNRAGRAGL